MLQNVYHIKTCYLSFFFISSSNSFVKETKIKSELFFDPRKNPHCPEKAKEIYEGGGGRKH